MAKFGGRILARLSTGLTISLRGTLNLSTAGQTNEAIMNQDGSLSLSATLKPRTAEITFEDKGIDYDALIKADPFNLTFTEEFTGVSHYFTTSIVVGEPVQNRMNGEVTGMSIAAEGYSKG